MWRSAMSAIFPVRKKPTLRCLSQTCTSASKHVIFCSFWRLMYMIRSEADVASSPLCATRPFQSISVPGALVASRAAPLQWSGFA